MRASELMSFLQDAIVRVGDVPVVFVREDGDGDSTLPDRMRVDVVSLVATTGEISFDGETAIASMICLCDQGTAIARLLGPSPHEATP